MPTSIPASTKPTKKLLDQVSDVLRLKHYSLRTESSYLGWIKRYILFHHKRHPQDMGAAEIEIFLTHLAVQDQVAASTQNQALSALLFLYREVLQQELDFPINAIRAHQPQRLPTILTKTEVQQVINCLAGPYLLPAKLLYGSGLRLMECVRLRVKDIDFAQRQVMVRNGKGSKDRITMLPDSLIQPLQGHLQQVKLLHQADLARGYGAVYLPFALDRKYPNANRDWLWQYLFPAAKLSVDPRSGLTRRHHLDPSNLQKAVRTAAKQSKITKHVTCHTFRHSFATHLLERSWIQSTKNNPLSIPVH